MEYVEGDPLKALCCWRKPWNTLGKSPALPHSHPNEQAATPELLTLVLNLTAGLKK